MSFRVATTAAGTLYLTLCAALIFAPEIVYWLFRLEQNDLGDFLARRAGALFLGLGVGCLAARNSKNPEVICTISTIQIAAMGVVALLGAYELARGFAGLGIVVSITVEVILVTVFLRLFLEARGSHSPGPGS